MAVGHLCSDINQGSLNSIIPFLIAAYNFNYATAATLVFLSNVIGSIIQPICGALADKKSRPSTMVIGMLLAAGGMSLTGFMTSFAGLAVCVMISGIGSAVFHPQAARLINKFSDKGHEGFAISVFSFGGSFGFAVGPILITAAIVGLGLKGTGVLAVPAIIASGFLFSQSKYMKDEQIEKSELAENELANSELAENGLANSELAENGHANSELAEGSEKTETGEEISAATLNDGITAAKKDSWGAFLVLGLFVLFRSIALMGMNTFTSLYFINELGKTEVFGNSMLSLYYSVSTLTTLFGGSLADRIGYTNLLKKASILLAVSIIAFSLAHSVIPCVILLIPIACAMNLTYSPIVVLGQKYLPNHVGLASGLTLGLAMSLGGIFSPLLGTIGDNHGLLIVMYVIGGISILPAIVSRFLFEPEK